MTHIDIYHVPVVPVVPVSRLASHRVELVAQKILTYSLFFS
jgi:hypothetical protein